MPQEPVVIREAAQPASPGTPRGGQQQQQQQQLQMQQQGRLGSTGGGGVEGEGETEEHFSEVES